MGINVWVMGVMSSGSMPGTHASSLERQLTGQHRTASDLRSRERFRYLGWLSHNKPQPATDYWWLACWLEIHVAGSPLSPPNPDL